MLVDEEIVGSIYEKLMDYLFKKCDSISLTKYHDQHEDERIHDLNVILKETGYSINYIIDNYSIQFLDEIYDRFKDNTKIFDLKSDVFTNQYKRICIDSIIDWLYYNEMTLKWLNKNKVNINNQKPIFLNNNSNKKKIYHSDDYYIKLTDDIKNEILNKKSLYDWCFPYSLEDICFFKDRNCWLYSVAHENLCIIYCESKEEFEYLKSIGVKFHDKEFKPTKMSKWQYSDGNK
ncbi:MAG: hypothetical protein HFI86_06745 [Bacilli bacterium]|nr:hypothetical protein [Bacilli bacterium]